jgi:hypothetical protein
MKFYRDETYIEMCKKGRRDLCTHLAGLPISHQYEPGDFYFSENDEKFLVAGPAWVSWPCKADTWLPRLDQLIEMVGWEMPTPAICHALMESITSIGDTWETGFLRLLMRFKYGKKWDFEKKEWVSI